MCEWCRTKKYYEEDEPSDAGRAYDAQETSKPSKEDPLGQKKCGCVSCTGTEQVVKITRETSKPSNPKDSVGIRKAPMSTVPSPVLFEIGLAMLEGARKYGRHNYRAVGVRASVYFDACKRHLDAWWEGEDIDPDSGLPHLAKAAACMVVLRDSLRRGNCEDDRPPKVEDGWMQELNALAAKIIDSHPDSKEAFTQRKEVAKNLAEQTRETIKMKKYSAFAGLAPLEKARSYDPLGPCEFEAALVSDLATFFPASEQLEKQAEKETEELRYGMSAGTNKR